MFILPAQDLLCNTLVFLQASRSEGEGFGGSSSTCAGCAFWLGGPLPRNGKLWSCVAGQWLMPILKSNYLINKQPNKAWYPQEHCGREVGLLAEPHCHLACEPGLYLALWNFPDKNSLDVNWNLWPPQNTQQGSVSPDSPHSLWLNHRVPSANTQAAAAPAHSRQTEHVLLQTWQSSTGI